MSDTIREIVIQSFITRAAVITTANGYNYGIGARVLRAQKKMDPSDLPAVDLIPGPEKSVGVYGKRSCTMKMHIEGHVKIGHNITPSDASKASEKILGDLKKSFLSQHDETVSPHTGWDRSTYIDDVIYTDGGTEEYPDEGSVSVGAFIDLDVSYTEKLDDPYSQ